MTFEVTFLASGPLPSETMVFTNTDIMELNLGYADEPARQAAMLAFVNGTAETWVDMFGRSRAYWKRLEDNQSATNEHLPSNTRDAD